MSLIYGDGPVDSRESVGSPDLFGRRPYWRARLQHCFDAVRATVEEPSRWTKGASARRSDGCSVDPQAADAICFCLHGALVRLLHATTGELELFTQVEERLNSITQAAGFIDYVDFNDADEVSHRDVLTLIDAARLFLTHGRLGVGPSS